MTKKEKLDELKKYRYAHRGFHDKPLIPENSMAGFLRAKEHGWGSEMDIHLMKDGNLAIVHDSDLKRVTGEELIIEELTAADLEKLTLEESSEHIPLFEDLLEIGIPLIVELKAYKGNYNELAAASWERLKNYKAPFCIESFEPRAVLWYTNNHPEVVRGQLSQNFFDGGEVDLSGLKKRIATNMWMNAFTKPDFIAYKYCDRGQKACQKWLQKGLQEVSWTIRTKEDLLMAESLGSIPIFEKFDPDL